MATPMYPYDCDLLMIASMILEPDTIIAGYPFFSQFYATFD